MRTATIKRKTKETDIEVSVALDGSGIATVRDRHRLFRSYARPCSRGIR
jgi:imidazoleglycerol phosphate dehydratase HisB